MRFLHTIHIAGLSSSDEHFTEETAPFLILQTVNGEDFLAVHIGQTEYRLDGVKTFLELALVEQHHHIRVVDDGFLNYLTSDDVLYLLRHHTHACPEFSGGLIQIFYVFRHHGRGDGFPCLLDDEHLSVLFDAHLLQEHVHDDERHQWKKQWIILDTVDFEDDEGLIKQTAVHILIQCHIVAASFIEVLQQIVVG